MASTQVDPSEDQVGLMNRLINILEKNSRGFEIITYGVTSIALLTALYRIRPFAKFSNPKKVPISFIKKQIVLKGTAARIQPGQPSLILIDHQPLINIPRFGTKKYLPVKIAGINITNNGISWLSTIVQGHEVKFLPIKKSDGYLECTISMEHANQKPVEIGKELVRLGFGTVEKIPLTPKNDLISSYEKTLLNAQKWAIFERNGHWQFAVPSTIWWRMKNSLYHKCRLSSWYQAPS